MATSSDLDKISVFCMFLFGIWITHHTQNRVECVLFGLDIFLDFASGFKWMILSSSCLDIE